jgi:hypothetical protein
VRRKIPIGVSGHMKAINNLKIFQESIDRNQFEPTVEALEQLGGDLVEAASMREGYEKLIWQAGYDLLVLSEDANAFYERFGYDAVASALRASIEDGTFPLSLGFIDYEFLPPSGGLEALAHHPLIQQSLQIFQDTSITLSLENFHKNPNIVKIGSQFLKYAQTLHLPTHLCLQMAAILLSMATNEQDSELATRAVLDQLASSKKSISLFYCWRAACERFPTLWEESIYMDGLVALLKTCRTLPDQGASILAQLHNDAEMIDAATLHPRMLYIMGLSGWWLYTRYNHAKGKDIAFNFLWSIMSSYPELCKALKSYLEGEGPPERSPEEIEQLQKDFQREMRLLREEMRLRIYRGLPLTLEIGSYNLIHILEPLYEAMEGASALPPDKYAQIRTLDATALVDQNPRQRAAPKSMRIIGNVRTDMISDYETIIALLRRALALREKLNAASTEVASTLPLGTPEIQREVATIIEADPELRWIFEWFLPETLQPASSAQFVESL